MSSSLPESPQPIGDLIGTAVRLCRSNLKLIFSTLIVPSILTSLGGGLLQWVCTYGVSDALESKNIGTQFGMFGFGLLALIVCVIAWWILGLRLLALVRYVLGFAATIQDAKAYINRRMFGVVGVYSLGILIFTVAFACCGFFMGIGAVMGSVMPAPMVKTLITAFSISLGIAGMITLMVFYALASHLSFCLIACEDESSVPAVIGRSIELIGKYLWRSIGFGILFVITYSVISAPLALPIGALTVIDYAQRAVTSEGLAAAGYKQPIWILVVSQAWESAIGIFLRPLVLFGFGLFYYDLRLRNEGLDIGRKLGVLTAKTSGAN